MASVIRVVMVIGLVYSLGEGFGPRRGRIEALKRRQICNGRKIFHSLRKGGELGSFSGGTLEISLFDEIHLTLLLSLDPSASYQTSRYFTGTVVDRESEVKLMLNQHGWTGFVALETTSFEITAYGNEIHRVYEIDRTKIGRVEVEPELPGPLKDRRPSQNNQTNFVPGVMSDDAGFVQDLIVPVATSSRAAVTDTEIISMKSSENIPVSSRRSASPVIDILVAYTDGAKIESGGKVAIENEISFFEKQINDVWQASGVNGRARVLATMEVQYNELSVGWNTRLLELATPGDGILDQVITKRDQVGADIVALWVEADSSPTAGIGFIGATAQTAFAVCEAKYYADYVCVHEVGHIMGCAHDMSNGGGNGMRSNANGYQNPSQGIRTVMAYPCSQSYCRVVGVHSMMTQKYQGMTIGESNAQCASLIRDRASVVANLRARKAPVPPTTRPPTQPSPKSKPSPARKACKRSVGPSSPTGQTVQLRITNMKPSPIDIKFLDTTGNEVQVTTIKTNYVTEFRARTGTSVKIYSSHGFCLRAFQLGTVNRNIMIASRR